MAPFGHWLGLQPPPAAAPCRGRACIHSWDICNEPRNRLPNAPSDVIAGWVHEAAGWVKSLDTRHPVTVGSEGFFGPSPPGECVHVLCGLSPAVGQQKGLVSAGRSHTRQRSGTRTCAFGDAGATGQLTCTANNGTAVPLQRAPPHLLELAHAA